MILAVIGSRTFNDYLLLQDTLEKYGKIDLIISGGAVGADTLAKRYARKHKIEFNDEDYRPDWHNLNVPNVRIKIRDGKRYNANAGFDRNEKIIRDCERVVAFWDGKSPGTKHSIDYAHKISKSIEVVRF